MKKALLRGLIGFPVGVTIGYAITIFTSLALCKGHYSPVVPDMAAQMGSEITAVAVQFILCGIMGVAFAAMSVIWESDRLNLAAVCTMIPIAYVCHWMEHSVEGALSYIAVFAGIYASIWVSMYFVYRANIKKINADLNK